jgi:transposase
MRSPFGLSDGVLGEHWVAMEIVRVEYRPNITKRVPGDRSNLSHKRQTDRLNLRRYATKGCRTCALKTRCTTSAQRVITRWEHEEVLEAMQRRLDENPQAMRQRRETVEHPFGTIKMRMGATHFLMKRLKNVRTEMALSVLAYNLTRVMNIIGIRPLLAAIQA